MATIEDFQLDSGFTPLIEKTLEEVISEGENEEQKAKSKEYITVNRMPIWIAAVLSDIKRKHRGASVSAVERLTSNLGLAVMRKRFSPDIDRIIEIHSKIYSSTDLILLYKCYEKCDYELKETFGTCYRKCSVREYAAGAISEFLVEPLNITTSTAVLLVLIAGISTSKTWVPSRWTNLAEKELNHFTLYLEDEEKRLKEVLLGKD